MKRGGKVRDGGGVVWCGGIRLCPYLFFPLGLSVALSSLLSFPDRAKEFEPGRGKTMAVDSGAQRFREGRAVEAYMDKAPPGISISELVWG